MEEEWKDVPPDERWYWACQSIRPLTAARKLGVASGTVREWAKTGYIRHKPTYGYAFPDLTYCAEDVDRIAEAIKGYERPGVWLLRLRLPQPDPKWAAQ